MPDLSEEDEDALRIMQEKYGDRLTEWESEFLAQIEEQGWMSPKQEEIFNRLWGRLNK